MSKAHVPIDISLRRYAALLIIDWYIIRKRLNKWIVGCIVEHKNHGRGLIQRIMWGTKKPYRVSFAAHSSQTNVVKFAQSDIHELEIVRGARLCVSFDEIGRVMLFVSTDAIRETLRAKDNQANGNPHMSKDMSRHKSNRMCKRMSKHMSSTGGNDTDTIGLNIDEHDSSTVTV